jgi:hypothetical protein
VDLNYQPIDLRYWRLARNHREIIAALKWAAGGRFTVEVTAPRGVCAEFTRQGREQRPIIHLVNLRKTAAAGVTVRVSGELAGDLNYVELRSPHFRAQILRKPALKGDDLVFRVPAFKKYLAAALCRA